MISSIQKSKFPVLIFILALLLTTMGFKAKQEIKPTGKGLTNCNINFQFTSTSTMAFAAVEDSFTDQTNSNITSWSGTFSYQSGALIFTVDMVAIHPPGTLTLTGPSGLIQTISVPRNSTAVYLLVESTPSCGGTYTVNFS